ncbi:carbohydrate ABC transporter permease [Streptomyces sporangiiformans]|uniref:Carbohydrate ABC transporter permease n=1 Tax=Streptomyces sporangiiformans TaxID=2315329 RepID=A0A505DLW9_9ACTN|nr:carbohydrate ABC transporter permease [Streptomyces sporangiiformans]TPQ20879.1 carbohydrate ABC transporter permease [Streptomyces sporangiiformans]
MKPARHPWLLTAIAVLITVAFLLPIYWMVKTSLTEPDRILAGSPRWIPAPLTTENYSAALEDDALLQALRNSLVISCGVVAITLLLGVPISYALARVRMRGSGAMVLALLVAQLPPSIVLAAPLFILERRAGIDDTYIGLIAADTTLTLPFAVIVLRPVLRGVPRELEEAALVDGCGLTGVLLRIVLPLMVPGLVAVAGLSFLIGWGEFVFGLTLAQDPDVQPVTVLLNAFVGQHGTSWGRLMATATLISIPVVCIFAIFQRFIVGGLTAGSIRG